jgi:hypothetical protein
VSQPPPEPGDRIVAYDDAVGVVTLQKPSGVRFQGCFAPIAEGRPLPPQAEFLVYTRDGEVYDVTALKGPSRVATKAYREGYDRVFGAETN